MFEYYIQLNKNNITFPVLLKKISKIEEILKEYESYGSLFLKYTLNFGKNKDNILEHSINMITKQLEVISKNPTYNFNNWNPIEYKILPLVENFEFSSVETNLNTFFSNNIFDIKVTTSNNHIYIYTDQITIYKENKNVINKKLHNLHIYKDFNINDLIIQKIDTPITGIGFQMRDAKVKKLTIVLNDDYKYYTSDYYNCFMAEQHYTFLDDPTYEINISKDDIIKNYNLYQHDIKRKINDLCILGINHPFIYKNGKFYHFKREEYFQKNEDPELIMECIYLGSILNARYPININVKSYKELIDFLSNDHLKIKEDVRKNNTQKYIPPQLRTKITS